MLEATLLLAILAISSLFPGNAAVQWLCAAFTVLLGIQFARLLRHKSPPFVPTPHKQVEEMIRLADVRPGETAWDLGCGDGRIVRAAARAGAIATGFELSYPTYLLAKILSLRTKNVFIKYANFWNEDPGEADVVFCFLLGKPMVRFQEEIWPRLKPGCRVVSYVFRMPGVTPAKRNGQVVLYVK